MNGGPGKKKTTWTVSQENQKSGFLEAWGGVLRIE